MGWATIALGPGLVGGLVASLGGDGGAGQGGSHWSQWGGWLAGAFAIVANVVGVMEIATTSRRLLSLIAGVLALVCGGVWLWRLLRSGRTSRAHRPLLGLNLSIMVIGAGIVGYVLAGPWRGDDRRDDLGASPSPGSSSVPTSGAPGLTSSSTPSSTTGPSSGGPPPGAVEPGVPAPDETRALPGGGGPATPPAAPGKTVSTSRPPSNQPFTGTIRIRYPEFGYTLASGQTLSGEITSWTAGHQVWMSARADGSSTELVQGPCQVYGATFVCSGVQLAGSSGTHQVIHVAVMTDQDAEQLGGANTLPVERAPAFDQTQVYKG